MVLTVDEQNFQVQTLMVVDEGLYTRPRFHNVQFLRS
jgi:hypothetical protein